MNWKVLALALCLTSAPMQAGWRGLYDAFGGETWDEVGNTFLEAFGEIREGTQETGRLAKRAFTGDDSLDDDGPSGCPSRLTHSTKQQRHPRK
ncbi:hypothetical protein K2X33_13235 [bacterium]|nr:hypothetical protein [bacterium]